MIEFQLRIYYNAKVIIKYIKNSFCSYVSKFLMKSYPIGKEQMACVSTGMALN